MVLSRKNSEKLKFSGFFFCEKVIFCVKRWRFSGSDVPAAMDVSAD